MREILQDEIDTLEEHRERAKAAAERFVRASMVDTVEILGDFAEGLVAVVAALEDELAPITTEAFESGVEFSRRRAKEHDQS